MVDPKNKIGKEKYKTRKIEGPDKITISYTNIDGLASKRLELVDYLREKKPDIICIAETKLRKDTIIQTDEYNYNIYRKERTTGKGGGVMMMVKKKFNVLEVKYGMENTEIISVEIKLNEIKQKIILTYVPPRTATWKGGEYMTMIDNTVLTLNKEIKDSENVIMVGDFNAKEINWEDFEVPDGVETWSTKLLQLAEENLLTQWVKEETRYRGSDVPARLDLIFTKGRGISGGVEHNCPLGKSDHEVLEVEIDKEHETETAEYKHKEKRRNYARANYKELSKYFPSINWTQLKNKRGIQEKYNYFLEIYNKGVQLYVPFYGKKKKGNKDWFNESCVAAKRLKDKTWKTYKKRSTEINREAYKMARNNYVKVRRDEEKKYEKSIIDKCKEEPKLFYKHLKRKLNRREDIKTIRENGQIYENDKDISEVMNNNFQKVFTKESEFCEREMRDGVVPVAAMEEVKVNKRELQELMKALDGTKSMGPDEVSGQILKECHEELIEPIFEIINYSIQTGTVPQEWKRADIIPIFKSGNRQESLNYRPISLTSIVCKLCEKIIKKQWVKYLERQMLIIASQFGFIQGKSCVTNLLCFYSRVIDVIQERDGWVDCIYLDLKKAFDKVPHGRLLWKLETKGGLRGNTLKWIKEYLVGREMRTVIRDVKSSWKMVTSGVPQGAVLAPVMFLIYINDMTEGMESYMNMFADDAKLLKRVRGKEDCDSIQVDLDRIYNWSVKWEVEFNTKKCHLMRMGRSKNRPIEEYKLGNEQISAVNNERDLGVLIEDSLLPEKHINRIFGETYGLLQNIRYAFHYMDIDMMHKIITSLIRPRLEYAAVVWSPHRKKDIKKLERIQKIATKMVPEISTLPYEERLKEMNLPTLEDRRERGDLIMLFKMINGIEKLDRENLFVREQREGLRGHCKRLRKETCLRDKKKYSFPHRTIDLWNGLEKEVVEAVSVHKMKERFDKIRNGDGTIRA